MMCLSVGSFVGSFACLLVGCFRLFVCSFARVSVVLYVCWVLAVCGFVCSFVVW